MNLYSIYNDFLYRISGFLPKDGSADLVLNKATKILP